MRALLLAMTSSVRAATAGTTSSLRTATHAPAEVRAKVIDSIRGQVFAAREGDGTFMDHSMNGRAYGTAQALILLAPGAEFEK